MINLIFIFFKIKSNKSHKDNIRFKSNLNCEKWPWRKSTVTKKISSVDGPWSQIFFKINMCIQTNTVYGNLENFWSRSIYGPLTEKFFWSRHFYVTASLTGEPLYNICIIQHDLRKLGSFQWDQPTKRRYVWLRK